MALSPLLLGRFTHSSLSTQREQVDFTSMRQKVLHPVLPSRVTMESTLRYEQDS